ncbi:MAG TPA: NYN domain-containing protein [Capillimicrobium sp.]
MRRFVDGMNVIGTRPDGWWRDRHAAMRQLVEQLERWVAATGEDVTVVFESKPSPPIRSTLVEVAYAPRARANSADDEIVRRLGELADLSQTRVVTSDHVLADLASAAGAAVSPASAFRAELDAL